MAKWIPIECSRFHAVSLNAVDSMQHGKMHPDWCSVIHAAWRNGTILNAVDFMQHGTKHADWIHCIQSCCIISTAFLRDALGLAAWNTLHSITLHGIHYIQWGCILQCCIEFTEFNHNAWNPLHSIGMLWAMLHKIHWFNHAAWNPLHSIGMHFTRLHGLHFIHSKCMESTAFYRDALGHTA